MKHLLKALFICLLGFVTLSVASQVQAATKTICAAGCGYTTIQDAFDDSPAEGDIYEVQGGGVSPYDPSSETWAVSFPNVSSTLLCTGGATISQTNPFGANRLTLTTSSTIQNCTFGNIELVTNSLGTGEPVGGIRLVNNTFSTSATSTISFVYGAKDFSILNNVNINSLFLSGTNTNGLIQNNTFYGRMAGRNQATMMAMSPTSSEIYIIGNTFSNRSTDGGGSHRMVVLEGSNIVFATNTVQYPIDFTSDTLDASVMSFASGANYVGGNFIDSPSSSARCSGLMITPSSDGPWSTSYTIRHNTVRLRGNCFSGRAIGLLTQFDRADIEVTVGAHYNLLYNAVTSTNSLGIEYRTSPSNTFTEANSYNGAYRFEGSVIHAIDGGGSSDVSDASTYTSNPFLKVFDADTTNDLQTAAFSGYLDVTGALDIGATNIARRTTTNIDDNGTIDYSTVDATSTSDINVYVRTGDSITLAPGSYEGFSVSSTHATSTITITGAGNSTVVTAASGADAIRLHGVSTSTLSGVRLTGAALGSATYTTTKLLFSHGLTDYNEGIAMFGVAPETMLVVPNGSCEVDFATADNFDVTSLTDSGTESFHIALVDILGNHLTVLVPNSVASSGGALEAACALEVPLTVETFISNVFTPTGGVYTYGAAAVAGAGATLVGVTDPPAITRTQASYAGIRLSQASGWTISNVTSTANLIGVAFEGTTANNTIQDSVVSNSTAYDVSLAANSQNIFDNVSFTRTSSTVVSPLGSLLVKFRARVYVSDTDGEVVSGMYATSTDVGMTERSFGATDGSGYTSYIRLPAYVINMMGSEVTNGGYNPYIVTVGSLSGYNASTSAAFNLSSRDQLVSIAAIRTSPTAPSATAASSITTTTAAISWTDNATNESSYLIDYVNVSTGESFPSSHASTLAADATSASLSGLAPNMEYLVRVAARNAGGTSSYATSSSFYTLATTSSAPTVSALSRTTVSVAIPDDGNSTSTQYAIYSSTLGSYLDASGVASSSATWQTSTTWATLTVSSLTCNTSYSFATIARNRGDIEAGTSTASTVTTSACATTSPTSGGGGGGGAVGGGGGGAGGAIQTFFNAPVAPISPVVPAPVVPVITNPQPAVVPLSPSLDVPVQITVQDFIERGLSSESRALGRGEREAVIRDLEETTGRSRAVLPPDDLDRVSRGEIPLTRSLAYERSMVPRALATFRSIFGHVPNFQNQTENLAWNTLMYRIRFPRNLTQERQGIVEFRQMFGRAPTTPFQWATVRVMGYLR